MTTAAGIGSDGFNEDNQLATDARLNSPYDIDINLINGGQSTYLVLNFNIMAKLDVNYLAFFCVLAICVTVGAIIYTESRHGEQLLQSKQESIIKLFALTIESLFIHIHGHLFI